MPLVRKQSMQQHSERIEGKEGRHWMHGEAEEAKRRSTFLVLLQSPFSLYHMNLPCLLAQKDTDYMESVKGCF